MVGGRSAGGEKDEWGKRKRSSEKGRGERSGEREAMREER